MAGLEAALAEGEAKARTVVLEAEAKGRERADKLDDRLDALRREAASSGEGAAARHTTELAKLEQARQEEAKALQGDLEARARDSEERRQKSELEYERKLAGN